MSTITKQTVGSEIEALSRDLEKLDLAQAQAVVRQARRSAREQWLRERIREGDESGEDLDGPTVMAELLAEAEAEIEAARRRGDL